MELDGADPAVGAPAGREGPSSGRYTPGAEWGAVGSRYWAQCRELPPAYGHFQTVHGRFRHWVREGILEQVLRRLSEELYAQDKLKLAEAFIDATFAPAKKGELAVRPTKRRKGTKIMAIADQHGLPLAITVEPASPHESRLVESTLAASSLNELPERLIGDKAYDSDGLDRQLAEQFGIEMIAPHSRNRRKTQNNHPLRRYFRRWKIERLFAWLGIYRRLVTRWEFYVRNFLDVVQLARAMLLVGNL